MAATERTLRYLKTRRRSILTSLTLIEKFVASYEEERDSAEVPIRLEAIASLWTDFNKVQVELETQDEAPDALDEYLKERVAFETTYYRVKGFLSQHCPALTSAPPSNPSAQSHSNHVKLPDVKLPTFTGKYEMWLNFHDLFVSLVHSSTELSSIQKFYYLRSSLAGEALNLIQTIPISATNYPVAWNLLVEHFQNARVLKRNYVQALFDFPVLRRESPSELHSLVEQFEANVKVLKQLGESTEHWDILLIHFLSSRLDPVTRRDWEEFSATHDNVVFKDLTDFVQRRVSVLQQMGSKQAEPQQAYQPRKPPNSRVGSHGAFQENRRKCLFCPEEHPTYICNIFSRMPVEEKEKLIKRHQLCRNCFRKGHMARDCPSENCCRRCKSRHHTQLCTANTFNQGRSTNAATSTNTTRSSSPSAATGATPAGPSLPSSSSRASTTPMNAAHSGVTSCNSQKSGRSKVLLATAVVIVVDDAGREHFARALLDSGSECCFATTQLSQMMNVRKTRVDVPITGIGKSAVKVKHQFQAVIKSRNSDYATSVDLLILPRVTTDLPSTDIDVSHWQIPANIDLADPAFFQSSTVDIVLGAEIFFDLFAVPGRISLGETLPSLTNSVFGWVVSGRTTQNTAHVPIHCNVATVADLHSYMEKFWKTEEDPAATNYSPDENACEDFFQRTVARDASGRYIVRLPFKEGMVQQLGDNKKEALRRFRLLENRLARDDSIAQQYRDFMTEYLQLGHMVPLSECGHDVRPRYYLPHHPVIKESSTTTKLRVVFDASSKTSTGISLNDALLVGPIVQDDLRSIILRSRTHPIVLIADAEKMYRQVRHFPDDYAYLCIYWRLPDKPIQTFVLQTVTYGTAAAPYLATRVLKQLATDEAENFPIAAEVVKKDFYVDDVFTGASTAAEAIELREQIDGMLSKGGFQMRKWASNCEAVLEDVPPENRAIKQSFDLDRDQTIKTLGLHWEPGTDQLKYKVDLELPPNTILTKRLTLSYIAQLFDPLGLVGPVVVTAKAFMQTLWTLKDENGKVWEWDRELPDSLRKRWIAYHTDLPALNELRINRFVLLPNSIDIELHIFSDASDIAYGTCAYLRSTDGQGQTHVALLTARSRIAPIQRQSTPKLELCGALLSAELYQRISTSLQFPFTTTFWTDSTTVLSWLKAIPSTWNTFVANRVSKIQNATQNCTWNHIAGLQNPADVISRGCLASELIHDKLWWGGPEWLGKKKDYWPIPGQQCGSTDQSDSERRKTATVFASTATTPSFLDEYVARFSNYTKMIRITAYCRRFLLMRSPKAERTLPTFLTTDELKIAEHALIRLLQQQCFPDEWKQLQSGQQVARSSRLKWFHPTLYNDNIIRIGGRLGQSAQHDDFKHPILLPGTHRLSELLLSSYHQKLLHAAPQLMVNTVRLKYWLLGGRSAARQIVHKCVICTRARPKLIEQFMSELPAARVTAARAFSRVGIDFWGPIQLQPRHRRDAPIKAYVAVFVCFTTKAVHIELVANLTTAKFLQAFRRFVARRGLCSDVYTDNGKNFVGAANELKRLVRSREYKDQVAHECTENGIRWHFNPPKGSHFGGLWEAAIRSAQKHFSRVLGPRLLAYDDMETLLAQIECCLNSRPLTPLTDDPSDLNALTPGHFLVGSALKAVPDVNLLSVPYNRLTQWQQTQKTFQDIWNRWHLEYLATLQPRAKWCNPPVDVQRNRLVIIQEEHVPPMRWPTGRIHELHPGKDGVVRVVTLQTARGFITRPVAKLCFLPVPASPDIDVESTDGAAVATPQQQP